MTEHVPEILLTAIASGAAMKYATKFVRALPLPDAESSHGYRWWFEFLNGFFENPDRIAEHRKATGK